MYKAQKFFISKHKSFQPPVMIKKTAFLTTKIEVNKPDLRRIYLHMVANQWNAKKYIDVLGKWRCDYYFFTCVQMIRRRHKYRPCVAEKQHIEIFSVANFVLSKNYLVMKRFVLNIVLFKKKRFLSSCLQNARKKAMG